MMASYISTGGLVVEKVMRYLVVGDARYNFMGISDPFHPFYQQRLTQYRSLNQQDEANLDYDATLAAYMRKATEFRSRIQQEGPNLDDDDADAGQRIVLPHLLDYRLPKGMSVKNLELSSSQHSLGLGMGMIFG